MSRMDSKVPFTSPEAVAMLPSNDLLQTQGFAVVASPKVAHISGCMWAGTVHVGTYLFVFMISMHV